MVQPPTLLQLIRRLHRHLDVSHTIDNTPATRRSYGYRYPAISISYKQLVCLQRLIKCLARPLKQSADAAVVTWSDVEDDISVSVLLANLLRFMGNIAWGRANHDFRVRGLLAAQITVQLSTQLGQCRPHKHYHYYLMGCSLHVIGQLVIHESLHLQLEQQMKMVVQLLCNVQMTVWCFLKKIAVHSVCRVLSCYTVRSARSNDARNQWVRLYNLSYVILDALALRRNGPEVSVLLMILHSRPSLLVRQPFHPIDEPPTFASMYAWFVSKQPSRQDRDRMIVICATRLFAEHNRHRVEAVKQLQLLSCFSQESVVLALPTIQSAACHHARFMSPAMHRKLLDLGKDLRKHRTKMGLPMNTLLTQFRKWARKQPIVAPL